MRIQIAALLGAAVVSVAATTSAAQYVSLCQPRSLEARARGCTIIGASQCEARTQNRLGVFPDRSVACAAACDNQYRKDCPTGTIGCQPCDLAETLKSPSLPK